MAYEKYIIKIEEFALALKFNMERREVILGGMIKYSGVMTSLINKFFQMDVPNPKVVQSNKIKFVFMSQYKTFSSAILAMQESGINVYQTNSHLTIMR